MIKLLNSDSIEGKTIIGVDMLYHYTNGTKLHQIKADGFIKSVPERPKPKEKPVAWLSSNSVFEKTANKVVMIGSQSKLCNMKETAHYCNGLYRFGFSEADLVGLFQWPRLAVAARIPESIKKRLVKRAKKASVPTAQWYGVLGDIPIHGSVFERWNGQGWEQADLDTEIARVAKEGFDVHSQSGLKRIPVKDSDWGNV